MNYDTYMRVVCRDELKKQRLIARSSHLVNHSMDAADISAAELAKRVLTKLGIKQDSDDPIAELETYLEGHVSQRAREERGGAEGIDRAEGGSFVDDYINGR